MKKFTLKISRDNRLRLDNNEHYAAEFERTRSTVAKKLKASLKNLDDAINEIDALAEALFADGQNSLASRLPNKPTKIWVDLNALVKDVEKIKLKAHKK